MVPMANRRLSLAILGVCFLDFSAGLLDAARTAASAT